jgi:hypothetical protein
MEVSGQLHAPAHFTPRERTPGTHWIGDWVGTKAGLDAVMKRKIPSPCRDSNPPIIYPVAQRYTAELFRLLHNLGNLKHITVKFCFLNTSCQLQKLLGNLNIIISKLMQWCSFPSRSVDLVTEEPRKQLSVWSWNPNFHYRAHRALNVTCPEVNESSPHLTCLRSVLISSSVLCLSLWSRLKFWEHFSFPHVSYRPVPSQYPWPARCNSTWWRL